MQVQRINSQNLSTNNKKSKRNSQPYFGMIKLKPGIVSGSREVEYSDTFLKNLSKAKKHFAEYIDKIEYTKKNNSVLFKNKAGNITSHIPSEDSDVIDSIDKIVRPYEYMKENYGKKITISKETKKQLKYNFTKYIEDATGFNEFLAKTTPDKKVSIEAYPEGLENAIMRIFGYNPALKVDVDGKKFVITRKTNFDKLNQSL